MHTEIFFIARQRQRFLVHICEGAHSVLTPKRMQSAKQMYSIHQTQTAKAVVFCAKYESVLGNYTQNDIAFLHAKHHEHGFRKTRRSYT